MKKRKSPCINACNFTHHKGWCSGCGRTRQECNRWRDMKPYEKNILNKELPRRLKLISKKSELD